MKLFHIISGFVFLFIGIILFPIVYLTLLIAEGFLSCTTLLYMFYRYFSFMSCHLDDLLIAINHDQTFDELLSQQPSNWESCKASAFNFKSIYHRWRQNYTEWMKSTFNIVIQWYQFQKSRRLIVNLNRDSSITFYRDIFSFLRDYTDVYHVVPEMLPLTDGILRITIRVSGFRAKDFTDEEIQSNFRYRLINALTQCDQLYDIPADYWEDAVMFPHLQKMQKQEQLSR
ncbi:MAG: hypothetical protein LUI14_07920 [Lachnospiraceae bacterium]|nr:hypothetical protein [Lachnospiraceae bacterium]